MKVEKKLIKLNTSRAIIIPNDWLDYQLKRGKQVESLSMDIQDETITISAESKNEIAGQI
jgi:hypothetical protein